MNAAIRWMAGNHVAANLLMLFFMVGGLMVSLQIKQEVFPDIALDYIEVVVVYPGAGPEEVEEGIILKIEENLTGIDGIKEVRSTASEGFGRVVAEIYPGEDQDKILQDIKSEVDRISTFPADAERPVVAKLLRKREVLTLAVYGDLPARGLREMADNIRDDLLALPNITQAELSGVRPYEISIEISEHTLRRYNLTLEQVARRIRQASQDLPGGTIKTGSGEVLVRSTERRYLGVEYGAIAIVHQEQGGEVLLGDIATIRDDFAETDETAFFDGKPAAMIEIFRIGAQSPKDISSTVHQYVAEKNESLPASIQLAVWKDRSEALVSRIDLLVSNGFMGLILVLLVLGLFLEVRLALWVMLGIPISFFGAFLFMPTMDASINMISLFAFIMALGIVVDDAIVVGENTYTQRAKGLPFGEAAVRGASQVATPVVFAILTSVVAFMPLFYVSGGMGKFINTIPKVVILILLVSLVECLFVLPAHLSRPRKKNDELWFLLRKPDQLRQKFGHWLTAFISGPYQRFLRWCLRHRYLTLSVALATLVITVGMVGGGIVKFHFMPKVESDTIRVALEMPTGTAVAKTREIQHLIEKESAETIAHFDALLPEGEETILRHLYSTVGRDGSHLATLSLNLTPAESRSVGSNQVADYWRQQVGEIAGVKSLTFANNLVHMGANIDIRLGHDDFEVLAEAVERVRAILVEYPGVGDITNSLSRGKKEMKITLKPAARTLGVTEEELGRQLRGAFYGAESLRLQRGRDEVKVMVRYPEEERRHLWNLENLRVRTPAGGEVPLYQAAHVLESKGFSQINRSDRKRVTNLTGSVDNKVANAEEIIADLQRGILKEVQGDFPGLTIDLEGQSKERQESLSSMKRGFAIALLAIYALLAIPLRSYVQPLLIMVAIPFGVVGAIWGHFILGYDLAIMSLFGIVALSGVVINDSLLLIDYVNQLRGRGIALVDALLAAAQRRFRPILLTSLTTFFGLGPILLETSTQAQFLVPMAISLAFGILFGTVIALLIVPALFLVFEDIRKFFSLNEAAAEEEQG
ncbi:MAG: efflux RND transporter permease subunit [Deltaproteobacteria bacterium]|jgi:multidrug efflux pump subunit AcrB|nr:efflux RND transporter permease subunit [Deltaproteobacteria bacterium]